MSSLDPGKAERAAKRQAKTTQAEIVRQRRDEQLKIAEEESEIAKRRMMRKTGGRSLLIATSRTGNPPMNGGRSDNLGGM